MIQVRLYHKQQNAGLGPGNEARNACSEINCRCVIIASSKQNTEAEDQQITSHILIWCNVEDRNKVYTSNGCPRTGGWAFTWHITYHELSHLGLVSFPDPPYDIGLPRYIVCRYMSWHNVVLTWYEVFKHLYICIISLPEHTRSWYEIEEIWASRPIFLLVKGHMYS